MSIGFLFWLLMIIWFVFGLYWQWPPAGAQGPAFGPIGGSVLLFILLFLLGWKEFGFPIHG
jgi:hypothetical protein